MSVAVASAKNKSAHRASTWLARVISDNQISVAPNANHASSMRRAADSNLPNVTFLVARTLNGDGLLYEHANLIDTPRLRTGITVASAPTGALDSPEPFWGYVFFADEDGDLIAMNPFQHDWADDLHIRLLPW